MKLFISGNSPYARRARIAARAAGLAVEEVDASPLAAENHFLLQHGPGAKVPALETDAGNFLCETLIISRYLNDLSGGKLLPSDAVAAEAVLELEGISSLLMDTLFHCSYEKRREPSEQSPAVIEKESLRARRCYDALENRLAGQDAILNLGTIAAIASLGYADWRHAADDWRKGREGLAAWADAMMKIPAVADTYPVF